MPAMSEDTATSGGSPEGRELRSEFLRGQLKEWLEEVVAGGRTEELFELEMWLRSFERFFNIRNQPLSVPERDHLALKDWTEELRVVDQVLLRVMHLCTAVLTEEQVNQARFGQYVESFLKRDDTLDPYVEKLLRLSGPEASLTLLRESFEDIHALLAELGGLPKTSFATFTAVGKLIHREVRRSHLITLLIEKKFKPIHDRIVNPAITATIRRAHPQERKHVARVLLELLRLLRYLDYASPTRLGSEDPKKVLLIFALIASELRLLLLFLERRVLPTMEPEQLLYQLYDSFVYCLPLELKKVVGSELTGVSSRPVEGIRSHVENSHGILRDSFQQSVVQLCQAFDPDVEGRDVFPDYVERRERSLHLRQALGAVIDAVRDFAGDADEEKASRVRGEVSAFYDESMRYLMYRDWADFERFFIEILKCPSLDSLREVAHRFETFLVTLQREVQKRAVLQGEEEPEVESGVQTAPEGTL
jgi:hypothetical protein